MNASVGDVLNQGRFAIYVSNISEEGILLQGNNLWVPTDGRAGAAPVYENMARAMGIDLGGWSFGAQFGDLNNDGFLDLYLVNGYVSASRDESYWYDYSKVAGGHQIVIGDAANWPAMGTRSLAGYQPKRVWINDGAGGFIDVAQMVGATDRHDGRVGRARRSHAAAACSTSSSPTSAGRCSLYKNDVAPGPALDRASICRAAARAMPADGLGRARCSNRSAIGAQVEVFWSGRQQVQEVSGGSGFCAQNQRRLHFGLGAAQTDRQGRHPLAVGQDAGTDRPRGEPRPSPRGAGMTTDAVRDRPPTATGVGGARPRLAHRQALPRADPRHHRPGRRPADVRLPRELVAHGAGDPARRSAIELVLARLFTGRVAAPGELLHLRHQRRHAGALAGVLAVRALLGDLDHVEVRAARRRPPHLESVQLRHRRDAGAGGGHGREPERAVGQHAAADGRGLGASAASSSTASAGSTSRRPTSRRSSRFAFVRAVVTGHPFLSEVAPITGPMYQLFIFFMITDPKTTVRPVWGQCVVAFLVAAVEAVFRLLEWVHAPVLRALPRRPRGQPDRDCQLLAAEAD